MQQELSKENYKNQNTQDKKELIEELSYEYAQNLKIPFVQFLFLKKSIKITLVIILFTYLNVSSNDTFFQVLALFFKYYFISFFLLYKITNLKYEDILPNKE